MSISTELQEERINWKQSQQQMGISAGGKDLVLKKYFSKVYFWQVYFQKYTFQKCTFDKRISKSILFKSVFLTSVFSKSVYFKGAFWQVYLQKYIFSERREKINWEQSEQEEGISKEKTKFLIRENQSKEQSCQYLLSLLTIFKN